MYLQHHSQPSLNLFSVWRDSLLHSVSSFFVVNNKLSGEFFFLQYFDDHFFAVSLLHFFYYFDSFLISPFLSCTFLMPFYKRFTTIFNTGNFSFFNSVFHNFCSKFSASFLSECLATYFLKFFFPYVEHLFSLFPSKMIIFKVAK